mgnify:CR=1 FL=1
MNLDVYLKWFILLIDVLKLKTSHVIPRGPVYSDLLITHKSWRLGMGVSSALSLGSVIGCV